MRVATLTIIASLFLCLARADASSQSTIDSIERMPRNRRLTEYEKALANKALSPADRTELTRAFAKHAKDVSPLYGKPPFPYNVNNWITLLKQGHDADPRDAHIALALAQLHIDRNEPRLALPVAQAFKEAHPQHHQALAFLAHCQEPAPRKPRDLLTFRIHFCVLTKNPAAHRAATLAQCRKEVDILNATFRAADGSQLVKFEFKSFTPYEQIKDSNDDLLAHGDATRYDGEAMTKAFNTTKDQRLRDPNAINIYIFDSKSTKAASADMTSHGRRNSNNPFVLIDFERLNNSVQNAQAHEMGHAFGLEHVGVPGATPQSSTNIMASIGEQFGSGGKRDLGFTPAQSAIILYHARRTADRLRLSK